MRVARRIVLALAAVTLGGCLPPLPPATVGGTPITGIFPPAVAPTQPSAPSAASQSVTTAALPAGPVTRTQRLDSMLYDRAVTGAVTPQPVAPQTMAQQLPQPAPPMNPPPVITAPASLPAAAPATAQRGLFQPTDSPRGLAHTIAIPPPVAAAASPASTGTVPARGDALAAAAMNAQASAYAPRLAPVGPAPRYTLDSGDRLRITVFGQEGLTSTYAVDAGGNVNMALIGPVKARGLTTEELAAAIASRLRQGYIREPHVAVEIESYRPFFILGEVATPGQYPYVANMTVETAVAIAGGFTPRADRKTATLNRTIHGQSYRGTVPLTYPVQPGDTIVIGERWF